jgi:asparagine synthase (glutamine-hydrolysing)
MCGISGSVNWGDASVLAEMSEIQAHRGPDDSGLWECVAPDQTWVGLANRRLSIIDLSPAGHMPMSNEDGTIWITFNGEIYNAKQLRSRLEACGHYFRSRSDTEVVIHLYEDDGVDSVKQLQGMFAFAICDLRRGTPRLFLARDHFGIKPLYYVRRGHRFAFASEAKALLRLPEMKASIRLSALHKYLTFLWVPGPETLFEEISKLLPGHYAVFESGELQTHEYWDLEIPSAHMVRRSSQRDLIQELRERFFDSVRRQMISDVPIGAFLSGGVDSSSIVSAMARTHTQKLRTYMITFPREDRVGYRTLDNPGVARRFADRFGCEHHEIVVEPDVVDLLPKLVWHMDEPTADPAIIAAYLVCRAARQSATVLLSGVGGDELFAGYRRHVAHRLAQRYQLLPRVLRREVFEPLLRYLPESRGSLYDFIRLAKKMGRSASLTSREAFLSSCMYLDQSQISDLTMLEEPKDFVNSDPMFWHTKYFDRVKHSDFVDQMLYVDMKTFMVSLNLNYTDKMSMASSVEVRVPFLDREFVEWVFTNVPPSLRLHGSIFPSTKFIFREALKDELGDEVLRQPKAGFGVPLQKWLLNDCREMVDDLLSESSIRRAGYFNPQMVSKMIREHRAGKYDWAMQIWQLITIQLWMQIFTGSIGDIEASPKL